MQWSNGEVLLKRIKFHSNQECEGFYEEIPITFGSYIIYITVYLIIIIIFGSILGQACGVARVPILANPKYRRQ